uniref:SFRICE_009975 n=1 Tax=Spodoptera frugiperda TaxID=7108 RepID=A0A2H1V973_SPOFR
MFSVNLLSILLAISIYASSSTAYYINPNYDCGEFGFSCERNNRVRICDGNKLFGPTFICPPGTFCNEESTAVCEDAINYIDPALTRRLRCHRNERIANPNVPGCKGYILCVSNGNRFQGINLKCSGNTIFNGFTRSCTSPQKYKCPANNSTKSTPELYSTKSSPEWYGSDLTRKDPSYNNNKPTMSLNDRFSGQRPASIECKNYKFRVTQDDTPNGVTYFCPPRPVRGESSIRCTIFSNNFCVTLERDDEEQFVDNGAPYRRPRM